MDATVFRWHADFFRVTFATLLIDSSTWLSSSSTPRNGWLTTKKMSAHRPKRKGTRIPVHTEGAVYVGPLGQLQTNSLYSDELGL